MRLLENLRNAEQRGVKAVREGMARAREEWGDIERRIRQRMRIYPQKLVRRNVLAAVADTELRPEASPELTNVTETRKPIVSVHGRDIPADELDRPAA